MKIFHIVAIAVSLAVPVMADATQARQGAPANDWVTNPRSVGISSLNETRTENRWLAARKYCAAEKGKARKACIRAFLDRKPT